MDDGFLAAIVYIIPGTFFSSLVLLFIFLMTRKTSLSGLIRLIGLVINLINFVLALSMVFLLIAHPYMYYAMISTAVSLICFFVIYFLKPPTTF